MRRQGRSGLALIAVGAMVAPAQKIAERLDATLVNLRFIKPLDEDLVLQIAARHSAVVTIEENVVAGGAGSAIGELLANQDIQTSLFHIAFRIASSSTARARTAWRWPDWTQLR